MTDDRRKQVDIVHMKVAEAYGSLSYANRLKVGALLVSDDRPISCGRNGTAPGESNECEDPIYDLDLLDRVKSVKYKTKEEVVHAEMNALAYAGRAGVSTNGTSLYITHSPCFNCAKLIVHSGVISVYYKNEYRLTEGLDYLRKRGIKVTKVEYDT